MIRLAVPVVVALGLAAAPTSLAAGTLSLDSSSSCYYTDKPVTITGQGWAPGDMISVTDPVPDFFTQVTADTTGTFTATFKAPILPTIKPTVKQFTAIATDTTQTTQTTSVPFFDVQPGVDANVNGKLTTPVVWTIAGFAGGQHIYGHWVYKHHSFKTLKMGTVPGACGLVTKKVPRLPTKPRNGIWTAQFDTSKTWHATTKPRVFLKIQVFTVIKQGAGR
jgi:hypothetical protein